MLTEFGDGVDDVFALFRCEVFGEFVGFDFFEAGEDGGEGFGGDDEKGETLFEVVEFFQLTNGLAGDDEKDGAVDARSVFEFFGGLFDIFSEVVGEVFGARGFGVEDDEEVEEFEHEVRFQSPTPSFGEGFVVVGFEIEFGFLAKVVKEGENGRFVFVPNAVALGDLGGLLGFVLATNAEAFFF